MNSIPQKIDPNLGALPLYFLQIPHLALSQLHSSQIYTIENFILYPLPPNPNFAILEEIRRNVLTNLDENGQLNWTKFWASNSNKFYYLFATCPELDNLSSVIGHVPVNRNNFGNAGNCLAKSGILTVHQLIQALAKGIEYVPGIGQTKVQQLFDDLILLMNRPKETETQKVAFPKKLKNWRDELPEDIKRLTIEDLDIGISLPHFQKNKIFTLSDLLNWQEKDSPLLPGITNTMRHQSLLLSQRVSLALRKDKSLDWYKFKTGLLENENFSNDWKGRISPKILALSLCHIHLGAKTQNFNNEGIHSIEDLFEWISNKYPKLSGVGSKTSKEARRLGLSLLHSILPDNTIDWDKFAVLAGIPLFPQEIKKISTPQKLLDALQQIHSEFISLIPDKTDQIIYQERIFTSRKAQPTLANLAERLNISTERVRQRQKVLESMIAEGIIQDHYSHELFRFRKDFCLFWRDALTSLSRAVKSPASPKPINIALQIFAETWHVPIEKLLPWENIILLIAKEAQQALPCELYQITHKIPHSFLEELSPVVANKKLNQLPITSGIIRILADQEIYTVGDCINASVTGKINLASQFYRDLIPCLQTISTLLTQKHLAPDAFWLNFAKAFNLTIIPLKDPSTPIEFLSSLRTALLTIINLSGSFHQSAQIFLLRTCLPANQKLSTQETAKICNIPLHQVIRLESNMLRLFYTHLSIKDWHQTPITWQENFLTFWDKAETVGKTCSNAIEFEKALSKHWEISSYELSENIDLIWQIINTANRTSQFLED